MQTAVFAAKVTTVSSRSDETHRRSLTSALDAATGVKHEMSMNQSKWRSYQDPTLAGFSLNKYHILKQNIFFSCGSLSL